jgi:polysaccharide biosynthesis/export protein ExoF
MKQSGAAIAIPSRHLRSLTELAALSRWQAACMLVLASAVAMDLAPASAQTGTEKAQSSVAAAVGPKSTPNYRLDRGDRLRVRFFDRFDREDLNGDYVLDEHGQLRLPRIGIFAARNKTTTELEQDLREFAERKGEKLGYFSIEISQCRPLYVGGLVNHPGAYPYVGGMTVLHAVALAGGIYRAPNVVAADALKEKSRLSDALERLKDLIARRARLEAERDDNPTVSVPDELLQLDPVRAGKLIELERNLLRGLRDVTSRDKDGLESFASLTNTEANTYQASITSITQRIGEQAGLFGELRRLYDQKLINHQRYFEAVNALDTAERDRNLAVAGLAHAKASIEKTKRDVAMLTLANKARVSKEIAEAEQEIARLKTIVLETRTLIEQLQMLPGGGSTGPAVTYRVMRRDENGAALFVRADETSLLSPDDVVQVELLPYEERMKLH